MTSHPELRQAKPTLDMLLTPIMVLSKMNRIDPRFSSRRSIMTTLRSVRGSGHPAS